MKVKLINPATEKKISEFKFEGLKSTQKTLDKAARFQLHWHQEKLSARIEVVRALADHLTADRERLARQIGLEMGKPLTQALSEIDKSTASLRVICDNFPRWIAEKEECLPSGYGVRLCPLGVTLGIMPWNFPLWQVVRFTVPSLLAGNTVLLKHAPNTFGVAQMIEDIFHKALPPGAYFNINLSVSDVAKLIAHPTIRGVSLTGSRQAGSKVGELAGRHLKKCVLELGGSDAYVILDDADIALAADVCARSRMQNAGQSCVAAKRFIVTKKNLASFTAALASHLEKIAPGDPLKAETKLGPLARQDLRASLHKQVQASLRKGAKALLGCKVPKDVGLYYPPSVLTNVKPGQTAFDEELFGPVAAIIEAKDEKDALRLANLSRYGLGGALFSKDAEKAYHLAVTEMDAGMVFVNEMVKSDAQVPFGGVKDSGLGRELGREGSLEFTNVKTIFKQ